MMTRNGWDFAGQTPEQATLRQIKQWNEEATRAWTHGNNSGCSETLAKCEAAVEQWQKCAEKKAAQFGWHIEYPGLNWLVLDAEEREMRA